MSDYIIEAGQPVEVMPQPQQEQVYTIKYTKVVKDLEGNDVEIIDDQRTERVTISQLESQKQGYQNAIKQVDEKLAKIKEMI